MSFLDRLSIRAKLIGATVGMLTILVGLGGFAATRTAAVAAQANELSDVWLKGTALIAAINDDVVDSRRVILSHVMATDAAQKRTLEDDLKDNLADVPGALEEYRKDIQSEEERRMVDRFATVWGEYQSFVPEILQRSRANDVEGVRAIVNRELAPRGYEATEILEKLVDMNEAGGAAAAKKAHDIYGLAWKLTAGVLVFAVLFGAAAAWMLISNIASGMRAVIDPMTRLSQGELEAEVPFRGLKTETGAIADAVQVFKQALVEKRRQDEADARRLEGERERARRLDALTAEFEAEIGALVSDLSSSADLMQQTASSMSATAEETNRQTVAVSDSSDRSAGAVQTVASACEELTASIHEIAQRVDQSAQVAARAVVETRRGDEAMRALHEVAGRVGEVVKMISEVAEQTNLLALNATIEAARAGEAGRGFTVVASEVKALAGQTAKATDDIAAQIADIQRSSENAAAALADIGRVVQEIDEIATTVASAVEEQRAATGEIARSVADAAAGASSVKENIKGVEQASSETGAAAHQVLGASRRVTDQSAVLSRKVDSFLTAVKAA